MSLYTAESLCHDCVGRYVTRDTSSPTAPIQLSLAALIDSSTYQKCYESLIRGLASQHSIGHSVKVPPIGIIAASKAVAYNRVVDQSHCLFHRTWLTQYSLTLAPRSYSCRVLESEETLSALNLNFATLARIARVDVTLYRTAVTHLLTRMSEVLSTVRQASFELGVGSLVAMNGVIDFVFHNQREVAMRSEAERQAAIDATIAQSKIVDAATVSSLINIVNSEKRRVKASEEEKELIDTRTRTLDNIPITALSPRTVNSNNGVPLPVRNIRGAPPLQPLRDSLSSKSEEIRTYYPTLSPRAQSPGHQQQLQSLFARKLPPVLDEFARTKAAPFITVEAGVYVSASSKIGSYYTPEAINYQIDPATAKLIYTGITHNNDDCRQSLAPMPSPSSASLDNRAAAKNAALYDYYVDHAIPNTILTPYKQQWARRALMLVSPSTPLLDCSYVDSQYTAMLEEIQHDYYDCVKRSMMDYILRSQSQRQRLTLLEPPASISDDWGNGSTQSIPPKDWRPRIQRAFRSLSSALYTNNPAMLYLLKTWHSKFSHRLLCSLPSPYDSTSSMTLKQFEANQRVAMNDTVTVLRTEYLTDIERELTVYARQAGLTDSNSNHFFDTIATVMKHQLRSIIVQSVQAIQSFVNHYCDGPRLTFANTEVAALSSIDNVITANQPIVALKLVIHKSRDGSLQVESDQPLTDLLSTVTRIIDSILVSLDGFHRIETKIFNILDATRTLDVEVSGEAGRELQSTITVIRAVLSSNIADCQRVLSLYDDYNFLLNEDRRIAAYLSEAHSLVEHDRQLTVYRKIRNDLRLQLLTVQPINVYLTQIDCRNVNAMLITRCEDCMDAITTDIAQRNIQANLTLVQQCKSIANILLKRPANTRELVDLQSSANQFKQVDRQRLRNDCEDLKSELLFLLDSEHCVVDSLLYQHIGSSYHWIQKLNRIVGESEVLIETERGRMERQIEERMEAYNSLCEELSLAIRALESWNEKSKMTEYIAKIEAFKAQISEAESEVTTLVEQEKLLGLSHSEIHPLSDIKAYLQPFDTLWSLAANYQRQHNTWLRGSILKLDASVVDSEVNDMTGTAQSLHTQLLTMAPLVASVASYLHTELIAMQSHLPLFHVLCNTGMRDRHWNQISAILGFDFKPDAHTTLARVLDLNIGPHVVALSEISTIASKEHEIEKSLTTMKTDWQSVTLSIKSWRESGTFVFTQESLDDCHSMLDDHSVRVLSLKGSPHCQPFIDELKQFESWLSLAATVLESSQSVQAVWLYLSPLFAGEEIFKQMPHEGQLFHSVDTHWRAFMSHVCADTHVQSILAIPHIALTLKDTLSQLEGIQVGLNHYLESKRQFFNRFYFLSNEELLAILSETKDPMAVMPYINKLFHGIQSLTYSDSLDFLSMVSVEGENVPFAKPVNPLNARGAVERWLKEIESMMRDTMKDSMRRALTAYNHDDRLEWLCQWPTQIILTCNELHFTANVCKALQHGGSDGVRLLQQRTVTDQRSLIDKYQSAPLTPNDRRTLTSVLVADSHHSEILSSLAANNVRAISHFDWLAQLRYYWNHLDDGIEIKSFDATLSYGMEYYGQSGNRLVLTPKTDRCHRTLIAAIHSGMATGTSGAADTGKSELIRSLAANVAVPCFTFNATASLDLHTINKFVKGLITSGSWSCFEDFHCLRLDVLSVIAQQIASIQQAKLSQLTAINFDGQELSFNHHCAIMVTMNHCNIRRSELPDSVKRQFRICALQMPEIDRIVEVMLTSHGFTEYQSLTKKLMKAMGLCIDLLSTQPHYHWGLRTVKSIVAAAIKIKQSNNQSLTETAIIHRAMIESQEAKFVAKDVDVYREIVSGLFEPQSAGTAEYQSLKVAIHDACQQCNLQPTPSFTAKVLVLYETLCSRHGVMLVGLPYSGKSCAIRVLSLALNDLAGKIETSIINGQREHGVTMTAINPKAVTISELYGQWDDKLFTEGILAREFASHCADPSSKRKWLVFDSAIDSDWIEGFNTVLDDTKALCLPNGRIISINSTQSLLFETRDLDTATPATISRCSVIHFSVNDSEQWQSLIKSWLTTLPSSAVSDEQRSRLLSLFDCFVPSLWHSVASSCVRPSNVSMLNAVESCTKVLSLLLTQAQPPVTDAVVDSLFLFSLVWGLGGAVDGDSRAIIDKRLRSLQLQHSAIITASSLFPTTDTDTLTVFDYFFDWTSRGWKSWKSLMPAENSMDVSTPFVDIIIPTVDTVRYHYLLSALIQSQTNILVTGSSGVGKTVVVSETLSKLNAAAIETITVHFSGQTSSSAVQSMIDSRLDRRRKGVYGATNGRRCVVFIEDLNLPSIDRSGSQAPCELLRQCMDHNGWYSAKDHSFHTIADIGFIAAMAPSNGGHRASVSDRVLRHFATLHLNPLTHGTMTHIFGSILRWHTRSNNFVPSITSLCDEIVSATLELYSQVTKELLPTPGKIHYMYNVRDLSRVFQGLTLAPATHFPSPEPFLRLWIHEVHRVFADRLIDDDDSQRFLDWCRALTQKHFGVTFPQLMAHLDEDHDGLFTAQEVRSLFFGDYLNRHRTPRLYVEITDLKRLHSAWSVYLDDYNAEHSKPMNLTLFRFAIEHVSRIARILRQPGGHALLIGVGGSGRQSLTRLAAYVSGCTVMTIDIHRHYQQAEWKGDLKAMLKRAAALSTHSVLMLSDAQLIDESFLEDVSGLLHSGSVPNLWTNEDCAELCELVREECRSLKPKHLTNIEPTNSELLTFFTSKIRSHLHVVLGLSPGSVFADRVRAFPALIQCCSIDWYSQWPHDALYSVAKDFMREMDLDDDTRAQAVDLCIYLHRDVESMSQSYVKELSRPAHITPTSYLELLTTFKTLLSFKRKETIKLKQRYLTGLDKLAASEKEILVMQSELEQLKPILEKTRAETEEMMHLVSAEAADAQLIRDGVLAEERIATQSAQHAKSIEEECASSLNEAMPMLEAAVNALDTLSSQEISELKALRAPPKGVKLVLEALCIMKKIGPARIPDPKNNGNFITDYWEPSKKHILSDMKLLKSLVSFEKDDINPQIMKKIRQYLAMPEFELSKLKAVSAAAGSIAVWIYAIESYDRVIKQVQPKREALETAQAEFVTLQAGLEAKQAELAKVEEKMASLNATLKEMVDAKAELESRMKNCSLKIERANILISRLGGERERWIEATENLTNKYEHLTGDMLLSSAAIAYLGPFTASYRQHAIERWCAKCALPFTSSFSLSAVLGEPVQTRRWVIEGLPNDTFSIENALMISKSRRWPLLIDPEGQANAWIKNMEKDNNLIVISASDEYEAQLEQAIEQGLPCLLEHVTETLDAALDPLLLKHITKKGSSKIINIHGKELPYNDSFRFFLTTKLNNPQYLPEVAVKVTLLNFQITSDGLGDQLLALAVSHERPELETERHRLVIASASNATRLKELEDKILAVMSASKGDILNDEQAIDVLSASKAIVNEIQEKQRIAARTELELESSRIHYQPLAQQASMIFFALQDLAMIDAMYQFSLPWFMNTFNTAMTNTGTIKELLTLNERIEALKRNVAALTFKRVSRAIDESHRLVFAILLCVRLSQSSGAITGDEWRWFLSTTKQNAAPINFVPNPAAWLSQVQWNELARLAACVSLFQPLCATFASDADEWKVYYDSVSHCGAYHSPLPSRWSQLLHPFHRLCLVSVLHRAQLARSMKEFVIEILGDDIITTDSVSVDLAGALKDSSNQSPMLCLLHGDCQADSYLDILVDDHSMSSKTHRLSLGVGQGQHALAAIDRAQSQGHWLLLENVHLADAFLPQLARVIERMAGQTDIHSGYRLILTAESLVGRPLPLSILQLSVKVSVQAPLSLRAHLLASYTKEPLRNPQYFEQSNNPSLLHSLSYVLALLHGVLCERRLYGSVGLTQYYPFTDSDLSLAQAQLHNAINSDSLSIPALRYLIGELIYGAKVTDSNDRQIVTELVHHFLRDDVVSVYQPGYQLAHDGSVAYVIPSADGSMTEFIQSLPPVTSPMTLGLHANAQHARHTAEAQLILSALRQTVKQTQPSDSDSYTRNDTVLQTVEATLKQLPPLFTTSTIANSDSLSSVLVQECSQFNDLLEVIRSSLSILQQSLTGGQVESKASEELANAIYDDSVPAMWSVGSTSPSLTLFVKELIARYSLFQQWYDSGVVPNKVSLGAFFQPRAFISALEQRFAAKHAVRLDEVTMQCQVMDGTGSTDEDSVELTNLFLEGAEWSHVHQSLIECQSAALVSPAPRIRLHPIISAGTIDSNDTSNDGSRYYQCPIYLTGSRRSIDPRQSSAVLSVRLPTQPELHWGDWTLRGVALVSSYSSTTSAFTTTATILVHQ